MNQENPQSFEDLPEVSAEVFASAALEKAVDEDNEEKAIEAKKDLENALETKAEGIISPEQKSLSEERVKKAIKELKAAAEAEEAKISKDKLPEELFNAVKFARAATGLENEGINFKSIKENSILDNPLNKSEINKGFEKVMVNGVETMLSRKISEPKTYIEAEIWIKENDPDGRMPTIEELKALYESDKADSFEGKVIWSSSVRLNAPQVFDFAHGRVELRNKEDEVNATRAVADIN